MTTIVDYGLGNVRAFENVFKRLGIQVQIARTKEELREAKGIILPGVGAFDCAMERLNRSGLRDTLDYLVQARNIKVLGVCVGMQMMAQRSEEGKAQGLGWIDGDVIKFERPSDVGSVTLPHMGWNDVRPKDSTGLFSTIEDPRFYFLHSYYVAPEDPLCTLATTKYGVNFTAAIRSGNIYGTQFHPEKSHDWGVTLLKNFSEI